MEYKSSELSIYELQSDEVEAVLGGTELPSTTSATVAEFMDETPGSTWSVEDTVRSNLIDQQPQVELAQYLSRPVLVKTHVWAQTDTASTYTTWNPWTLFFNSAPIKNKLQNYGLISCKLKLKFVINASPFYSGAMAFTYCPLQSLVGTSIIPDAYGGELMGHSQRPKVWIFPQTSQGGEIELPFFYHKNWLDITSISDCNDMGTITPCLFSSLTSATGITGTSVIVNVYAWAEDVKLHAPTIKAALQADEFDYKPSQIASSVASATSLLSRIPLIGPYMKATSAVATNVSNYASALGFTNVPNTNTVEHYKTASHPYMSTCDISVPSDRAAVDPKNEVSLDPRTVGLSGNDELAITNIACRECFIGNAILSSSDVVDSLTLVARVTPCMILQPTATTPRQYTPMGYLCEMFNAWRGDIIFRFKFVCTRFHKGRVRITFDPKGNISSTVPDYTTVFNEIVDIGAEQDVEVRVPYMAATTYLKTALANGNYNLSGTALAPDNTIANGLITMRVVNPLSGPVANTAIAVMVFVRAADNIEFAWPNTRQNGTTVLSPYTLQSDEVSYPIKPMQIVAGNKVNMGDPYKNLIHYGERIVSLRPLIHRMYFQYSVGFPTAGINQGITVSLSSRRLKYAGFDANGIQTANKTLSAGTAPYNFFRMSVPQLVSLLFIGQRGSMNWCINTESQGTGTVTPQLTMKRYVGTITTANYAQTISTASASYNVLAAFVDSNYDDPGSGVALTDQRLQPGLVMNFPYYSRYNFQFVQPNFANLGNTADDTDIDNIAVESITSNGNTSIKRLYYYASCGHDYNFFFFINTPSLYSYTAPTGA